jgi:NADH dehydrogenase (ubiquinone) Fe-S protein 8
MVARPQTSQLFMRQSPYLVATSQFHTSTPHNATPYGQPPKGFRLPRPKRFDEGESAMDKASNYFLLTEMFRGMYVVMEQFFRPPYAHRLHKLVQPC